MRTLLTLLPVGLAMLALPCGAQFSTARASTTKPPTPAVARASGGPAGQFAPTTCGRYDDGTTEDSLGLTMGGELGWIHTFDCVTTLDAIETAYGTALFPGSVTNGANSRLAVYDEAGGDPNAFGLPVAVANTVVVNGSTDILNSFPIGPVSFTANAAILATADQAAGEYPAPMDTDNPTMNSWVVGSTLGPGSLDLGNLVNNTVPPVRTATIGFPSSWLLSTPNTASPTCTTACMVCSDTNHAIACLICQSCNTLRFCPGDGSGSPCGCGNADLPGSTGGCLNGLGVGADLLSGGNPSISSDTVTMLVDGVTNQPGLFFQGDNAVNGGAGATFGDGIRCVGQNVVRLEIADPPGATQPTTAYLTATITSQGAGGTVQPGDEKYYQYWYRNSGTSPCGSNFNLSNAVAVTWMP